jgi:serine/threonine protein phosphatase 1
MATIAIGDVHGNISALERVLRLVESEVDASDTVVFLGDYIDRGLETRGCIDSILAFRAESPAAVVCLLGNHEDWLLDTLNDSTDHTWLLATDAIETIQSYSIDAATEIARSARAAGRDLYQSRVPLPYSLFFDVMPPAHLEFLRSLRHYHQTANAVCVHGGLDPDLGAVENQTSQALVWGTSDFQHRYTGEPPLVYGHWSNARSCPDGRAEPLVIGRTIGIDSITRGTLTALKMPDGLVLQSNAVRSWVYSSVEAHWGGRQPVSLRS